MDNSDENQLADRPRGIITRTDREFLIGEQELDNQKASDRRYRIRKRLENALLDIMLLSEHLESNDRAKVFRQSFGDNHRQLQKIFNFFIEGARDTTISDEELGEIAGRTILNQSKRRVPLSDTQKEALMIANEKGYFNIPRKTTKQELAEEMGMSDMSYSHSLRDGIRGLINANYDKLKNVD